MFYRFLDDIPRIFVLQKWFSGFGMEKLLLLEPGSDCLKRITRETRDGLADKPSHARLGCLPKTTWLPVKFRQGQQFFIHPHLNGGVDA